MFARFLLCATTVLVIFVLHVQSNEQNGPIIVKTSGHGGKHSDLVLIGAKHKCGQDPTIIKTGKRHWSDLILLGGHNKCKETKMEQTEQMPLSYPVNDQGYAPMSGTFDWQSHIANNLLGPRMGGTNNYMSGYNNYGLGGLNYYRRR